MNPSASWPPLLYGIQLLYPCCKMFPITRWCPESFGTWTTCARHVVHACAETPAEEESQVVNLLLMRVACDIVAKRLTMWAVAKLLRYLEGTLWLQEELNRSKTSSCHLSCLQFPNVIKPLLPHGSLDGQLQFPPAYTTCDLTSQCSAPAPAEPGEGRRNYRGWDGTGGCF